MTVNRALVPFKRWHYGWLGIDQRVSEEVLLQMEIGNSWSAIVDGEVMACGGTVEHWPGRHVAWSYMTPATGRHMRWLTQEALNKISEIKGRIEMTVRCDFKAGHHWARMLGFKVEAPRMAAYGPVGEDHTLYARVN